MASAGTRSIDLSKVAPDAVHFKVLPESYSSSLVVYGIVCFGKDMQHIKTAIGGSILRPRDIEGFRVLRNVVGMKHLMQLPPGRLELGESLMPSNSSEHGERVAVLLHPPSSPAPPGELGQPEVAEAAAVRAPKMLGNPLRDGLTAGKAAGGGEELSILDENAHAAASQPRPKNWANAAIQSVSIPESPGILASLGYGEEVSALMDPTAAANAGMLEPAAPIRFLLRGGYEGTSAQAAISAFLPIADPQEGLAPEAGTSGSSTAQNQTSSSAGPPSLYARQAASGAGSLESELHRLPSSSSSSAVPGGVEQESTVEMPSGGGGAISSFEQAGDVAHVNLVQSHFPWRYAVGRVLLDHHPTLKTVLVKCGTIESVYRTFPMQVVSGAGAREEAIARSTGTALPPIPVTLRETDCSLRFDFRRVYWNSRLQHEHRNMVEAIVDAGVPGADAEAGASRPADEDASAGSNNTSGKAGPSRKRKRGKSGNASAGRGIIVADACAGVGPFAVPLARRGATVLANDLNPESFKWLEHNAETNKCGPLLVSSRDDGGNFLMRLVAAAQSEPVPGVRLPADEAAPGKGSEEQPSMSSLGGGSSSGIADDVSVTVPAMGFDHILINLPASSVQFIPVLRGIFDHVTWPRAELPIVHCYTFAAAPYSRDGTLSRLALLEGGSTDPAAVDAPADGVLASNRGFPAEDGARKSPSAGRGASSEPAGEAGIASDGSSSSTSSPSAHHSAREREAMSIEDATQRVLHALGITHLSEQRRRVRQVGSISEVVQASSSSDGDDGSTEATSLVHVCGRVIRDVSPNKYMVCISVRVPRDCGFKGRRSGDGESKAQAPKQVLSGESSHASKRPRVEESA